VGDDFTTWQPADDSPINDPSRPFFGPLFWILAWPLLFQLTHFKQHAMFAYGKQPEMQPPGPLDPVDWDILTSKCFGSAKEGYAMFSMMTVSVLDYLMAAATYPAGSDGGSELRRIFGSDSVLAHYTRPEVVAEFKLKLKFPPLRFRVIDPQAVPAKGMRKSQEGVIQSPSNSPSKRVGASSQGQT